MCRCRGIRKERNLRPLPRPWVRDSISFSWATSLCHPHPGVALDAEVFVGCKVGIVPSCRIGSVTILQGGRTDGACMVAYPHRHVASPLGPCRRTGTRLHGLGDAENESIFLATPPLHLRHILSRMRIERKKYNGFIYLADMFPDSSEKKHTAREAPRNTWLPTPLHGSSIHSMVPSTTPTSSQCFVYPLPCV